jgi:hypothetical protein
MVCTRYKFNLNLLFSLLLYKAYCFSVITLLNLSSQILTGDMEGIPVVTIKKHEIKKVCADKMFTALDRNKKCLSINNTVDISEGPTEVKNIR